MASVRAPWVPPPAQTEARAQARCLVISVSADRRPQRRLTCRKPAALGVVVGDRRRQRGRCAASETDESAVSAAVAVPEVMSGPPDQLPMPRDSVRCGSVLGASALIAGSAIGGGVLALPAATAQIGLIPATTSLVAVWLYSCAQVRTEPHLIASRSVSIRRWPHQHPHRRLASMHSLCASDTAQDTRTSSATLSDAFETSRPAGALGRLAGCQRHAARIGHRDVAQGSS